MNEFITRRKEYYNDRKKEKKTYNKAYSLKERHSTGQVVFRLSYEYSTTVLPGHILIISPSCICNKSAVFDIASSCHINANNIIIPTAVPIIISNSNKNNFIIIMMNNMIDVYVWIVSLMVSNKITPLLKHQTLKRNDHKEVNQNPSQNH